MVETKVDVITDAFREQILRGDFGTLGRLPSQRMLAEQFDTTRETINKVIQRLQAEGLLVSHGTAGVFVSPRTRMPGITARFDLYLKEHGLVPVETDIDAPSLVLASSEVAGVFGIVVGKPIARRYRRQGTTTTHYRLTENFYSPELLDQEILEQMQKDVSSDALLAIKQKHGKSISRLHDTVVGRLPTTQEMSLLEINRHSPVLEAHRISRSEDGTVIMYSRIIYVASYFELSYDYSVPYWTGGEKKND
jgi:DNA-binding GntR family transcriptional regulator